VVDNHTQVGTGLGNCPHTCKLAARNEYFAIVGLAHWDLAALGDLLSLDGKFDLTLLVEFLRWGSIWGY